MQPKLKTPVGRNWVAAIACAVLLAVFATIAWRAAETKSPAYDESYHAPAGWTHLRQRDFRLDCEDPPLWQYWAAMPNSSNALAADFGSNAWVNQPRQMVLQWYWCVSTLYRTPGNDGLGFIARSRAMMLGLAVVLGALIATWAWRLRGPAAAVVSACLFCLDPNFLAHSPLVKNDVAFSLAMLAFMVMVWRAGQKLTWPRVFIIAVLAAVMLTTKFSGVLVTILLPAMLIIRSLIHAPWPALGHDRTSFRSRLGVAAVVCGISAVVAFAGIWAVYGFRFSPTADPSVLLNTSEIADMAAVNEFIAAHGGQTPTENDLRGARPSGYVRAVRLAEAHHVLPQAWLAGLLFTYQSALIRPAFLMGEVSLTGWWYYFPFAMAVKTPLATLIAAAGAAILIVGAFRRGAFRYTETRWAAFCILVPFAIYLASAMRSNLNIGVRHVLPLYPFVFVAMGCGGQYLWRKAGMKFKSVMIVLAVMLAAESLAAFPDYIPFFNVLAGGEQNGPHLLGDSNVDWGQDLALLHDWRQSHSDQPLYLSYFGLTDPAYYHLNYTPLPGGYHYDPKPAWPTKPGVLAVSVSNLQGTLVDRELYNLFYAQLWQQKPAQVLGGSIYLYAWPLIVQPVQPEQPGRDEPGR